MKALMAIFTAGFLLIGSVAWGCGGGGFGGGGGGFGGGAMGGGGGFGGGAMGGGGGGFGMPMDPMGMMAMMMGGGGFGGMGPMGGGGVGFGPTGGAPWGSPGPITWGPPAPISTTPGTPIIGHLLQQQGLYRLSQEQVQQLQRIYNETQPEVTREATGLQKGEQEFNALMAQYPIDLAKVEAKVKELEGVRSQGRLALATADAKAKALLTPDQRQQLQQPRR